MLVEKFDNTYTITAMVYDTEVTKTYDCVELGLSEREIITLFNNQVTGYRKGKYTNVSK